VLHVGVAGRTADAAELIKTQVSGVVSAEITDGHVRVTLAPGPSDPSSIAQKLVTAGFRLTRLEEEKVNLETAFMRLTKGLVQ
jgi:ABC-2 type transport system ATP-binding protein